MFFPDHRTQMLDELPLNIRQVFEVETLRFMGFGPTLAMAFTRRFWNCPICMGKKLPWAYAQFSCPYRNYAICEGIWYWQSISILSIRWWFFLNKMKVCPRRGVRPPGCVYCLLVRSNVWIDWVFLYQTLKLQNQRARTFDTTYSAEKCGHDLGTTRISWVRWNEQYAFQSHLKTIGSWTFTNHSDEPTETLRFLHEAAEVKG